MREKLKTSFVIFSLFLCLSARVTTATAQEAPNITAEIHQPVHGYYVFVDPENEKLLQMLNTFTGQLSIIAESKTIFISPLWDKHRKNLIYQTDEGNVILNPFTGEKRMLELPDGINSFHDFSTDGTKLLYTRYHYDEASETANEAKYALNIVDTKNGEVQTLFEFQLEQAIENEGLPLLSNLKRAKFYTMRSAGWNTAHPDWIFFEFGMTNPDELVLGYNGEYEVIVNISILYNLRTKEMISLDNQFEYPILDAQWIGDGNCLYVLTDSEVPRETQSYLISFTSNGQLQPVEELQNPPNIEAWFGVDDLLLSGTSNDYDLKLVQRSISRMVNNELNSVAFFTIHGISYPRGGGKWYLAATDDEKRELAYLFKQSKPECN